MNWRIRLTCWDTWLLAIMACGAAVALVRCVSGIGSIANINNAYPWGWWVGYGIMTMVALGEVGFTITALVEILGAHRYHLFLRPAVLMGLLCYSSAIGMLMIELGRPWMVWMILVSSAPTSALYEVGWCAFLYLNVLVLEFVQVPLAQLGWGRALRLLRVIYIPSFMPDYEPEKKELASRDVVSRRMEEHIARGKGVPSRFGEHLWLDITLLGEQHIKHNLREVYEICHYFLGVDAVQEWIPVRPAQHYTMGGVRTNHTGESPTLKGLFAAGEAACWDMHGFNRLGGNSVAETVVAGMIVGESIADFCERSENAGDIPTRLVQEALRCEQTKIDVLIDGGGTEDAAALMAAMQTIMTTKVGIFRTGQVLEEAVHGLQQLFVRSRNIGLRYKARGANPELVTAYRVQKMLKLALCVAYGALQRSESRGAHFREDFPRRNDAAWLNRTLATWPSASDTLPTLTYEPLDVMQMELPPGWRGYGARDHVDHPDTARRLAEIETLKQRRNGADRFALQEMLMPYAHLLPACFRGRNERLDERMAPASLGGR